MTHFWFWPESRYWSFQFTRYASQIDFGGASFEELHRTSARIEPGNVESFHAEWLALARELEAVAETAAAKGNRVSARRSFLRASTYYLLAQLLLPMGDPRKLQLLEANYRAFTNAAHHIWPRPERVAVPYSGITLPGFYFPPQGPAKKHPAIIFINGGEMTASEVYFLLGAAAAEAGFGFMCYDQPGNPLSVLKFGLPTVPNSEAFVSPAVDYLVRRPDVDADRIVLVGTGLLGSCVAPRAAVGEPRIAATVVSCAPISFSTPLEQNYRKRAAEYGQFISGMIGAKQNTLEDLVEAARRFDLADLLPLLKSPLLVMQGLDDDRFPDPAGSAKEYINCAGSALKRSILFETASLIGGTHHCQLDNVNAAHIAIFDWLSEIGLLEPRDVAATMQS